MDFSGKTVLVTGATRGIGLAIAEAFSKKGAEVICTGTRDEEDANIDIDIGSYYKTNFLQLEDIEACAHFVKQRQPDILINNAGINKIAPFVDITSEDFLAIQQVNLFAPFRLCQACIPAMKRKGWGRIVNISSIWGKISKSHRASYSSAKFALDGMTLALALEHAADGIVANSVAPGFTDTALTRSVLGDEQIKQLMASVPAHRMADIDEIAHFVLWLASPDNSYITGQNIAIDGGFSRS